MSRKRCGGTIPPREEFGKSIVSRRKKGRQKMAIDEAVIEEAKKQGITQQDIEIFKKAIEIDYFIRKNGIEELSRKVGKSPEVILKRLKKINRFLFKVFISSLREPLKED